MSRLIDADDYRAEMKKRQDACIKWQSSTVEEDGEMYARAEQALATFVEAALTLDRMPTIDAILVEWMREKMKTPCMTCANPFDYVLVAWQDEQKEQDGTDNSDKNGTWESLGHRMGPLKHPLSEDFKCPLCGYEAYTVLAPPPDRCPECNARLSLEQGEKS